VWGLTQEHGGPCGVLAAIQSELLRILLFSPTQQVHPISMIPLLVPPTIRRQQPPTQPQSPTLHPPDHQTTLTPLLLQQALALSMGTILARATVMPPATLQDGTPPTADHHHYHTNNTTSEAEEKHVATMPTTKSTTTSTTTKTASNQSIVHIILPKPQLWNTLSHLQWQHLQPWTDADHPRGTGRSDCLVTFDISVPTIGDDHNHNNNRNHTVPVNQTAKRQKRGDPNNDSDEYNTGPEDDYSDTDDNNDDNNDHHHRIINELAHAVAQFLLETNALQWFQRPGGVLLFVMSLALSRGIPTIQSDMDDATAHLTSNFGHCSQELINLLLTGQAGKRPGVRFVLLAL
jgi:hypothetical protein